MKIVADTPSGWMHYVKDVIGGLGRPLTDAEYKIVMKCYISPKSFDQTIEEIQNVTN